MEKTTPKTHPREGRDESSGTKGDAEDVDAVSGNNKRVKYRKTYRQDPWKEGNALGEFQLKVNEGELSLERGTGGGDDQGGTQRYACR